MHLWPSVGSIPFTGMETWRVGSVVSGYVLVLGKPEKREGSENVISTATAKSRGLEVL